MKVKKKQVFATSCSPRGLSTGLEVALKRRHRSESGKKSYLKVVWGLAGRGGQYYFWMLLGRRSTCRATAHNVTSQPLVVSYHLPFNLTENMSRRCAVVCVSSVFFFLLFFFFFCVEFVFGGHFSVQMLCITPPLHTLAVITMAICWWKCEVQLLLVSISS